MDLTPEQEKVVEIAAGRHLVLAPPGSGKTEMLSRRILRAVRHGVSAKGMLCATFTNRAAFEMRDRVSAEAEGLELPDVGNLHHFCEWFLREVGVIHAGTHVIDEVEQREFAREVVGVLRTELRSGVPPNLKKTHGVTVLAHVPDRTAERVTKMREDFETYIAFCEKNEIDPAGDVVACIAYVHCRRIGIPRRLTPPRPAHVGLLLAIGVLWPLEKAYQGLKRRFLALDFDDLLNETYLRLMRRPLAEERRFQWVQIDEVQDLNPLQWAIIRELTASDAVSVYFGDLEQAIFSFLGASLRRLMEETADCERHYFRTNFRATPRLLELLMRYSLDRLGSERTFLSAPVDVGRKNGLVRFRNCEGDDRDVVLKEVDGLLRTDGVKDVALLVRSNRTADLLAEAVKDLGWRTVKVSGFELGHFRPMRDFMAFVDLFAGCPSRIAWIALVRRFGEGISDATQARYFVRGMFASGWNPLLLFADVSPIPILPLFGSRGSRWAGGHRRVLVSLRRELKPLYDRVREKVVGRFSFRELFELFAEKVFDGRRRYGVRELLPRTDARSWGDCRISYAECCRMARERIEKFLRYTDHVYGKDERAFAEILRAEWRVMRRLKEADLLVGDERIVVSTVHKAKGRQFDAVVVPEVETFDKEEEARRVLYVAMSRARRHLVLLGKSEGSSLSRYAECFQSEYEGYYLRKARGDNLSEDWLFQWEELAELDARRKYDRNRVRNGLASEWSPVARMAVKVVRHMEDGARRREVLLGLLGRRRLYDVVVDVLREIRVFDDEACRTIRTDCVRGLGLKDWLVTLDYFRAGMEVGRMELFRPCVEAGLYAFHAEVRLLAAEILDESCATAWCTQVYGTSSDFERLGHVFAPCHEAMIRELLQIPHLPSEYESSLRQVILMRSARL